MTRDFNIVAVWGTDGNFPSETRTIAPDHPQMFLKSSHAVIDDGQPLILHPDISQRVVCEAELAIVIGTECRNVANSDSARDMILGYTVANDVSARDLQDIDSHWSRAKSLDGFCPLGSHLISPDAAPAWKDAVIRSTLDGVLVQESTVSEAYISPEELIVWASGQFTLYPGDVFLLGTPAYLPPQGEAAAVLRPGVEMVASIEGIGQVRTPVLSSLDLSNHEALDAQHD